MSLSSLAQWVRMWFDDTPIAFDTLDELTPAQRNTTIKRPGILARRTDVLAGKYDIPDGNQQWRLYLLIACLFGVVVFLLSHCTFVPSPAVPPHHGDFRYYFLTPGQWHQVAPDLPLDDPQLHVTVGCIACPVSTVPCVAMAPTDQVDVVLHPGERRELDGVGWQGKVLICTE